MTKLQRYTIIPIVFLAFVPLFYQFMRPHVSIDELFKNSFTPQKFLVTREGYRSSEKPITDAGKTLYYEAVKAYSKEEYASAALLFERYITQLPEKEKEVALYLGISYLGTDQLQAAQKQFKALTKNGSLNKKQDAEWYLVLTLLKEKNIEQVRQELNNIITQPSPHAYQEKAQTLLKEIQQQYRS